MPQITAITPQRRKGRLSIFIDGEFVVGVGEKVVADLALAVGRPIGAPELLRISRAEEVRRATDSALRLLEVRARSTKEIAVRLKQKGYEEDVAGEALASLARLGLVNDAEFADQWVQSRSRSRPGGVRKLRSELFQKGIAKETIEDAVGRVSEDDELALARQALARKLRRLPEDRDARREEYRRLAGFLQRRGFGWDVAKKALAESFAADADDLDS